MFSRRWRFGWDRFSEVDLFSGRPESNAETLSQAIRAAASEEPDADGSVLFGNLQGTVVGLRYYTGVVNKGEMVGLVREPQNQYDRNAVMVANTYGNQVGHIKKELASAMAHVMDNNLAKVEGVVHSGSKNSFTMPLMLSFWGREENKNAVTEYLTRRGFKLNTSGKATGANSKSYNSEAARALASKKGLTIALTAEELKNAFDNLFEGLVESKDGEKEAAKSVGTPLLPHQKQALSWMCARENKSALPPFWEKRGELYYNSLTCFSAKEIPERVRGGILADDMGLGKTLTTIALILTNFHGGKPLPVEKCTEKSSPFKAKSKSQTASKLEGSSSAVDGARLCNAAAGSDLHQDQEISPDVLKKVVESDKTTCKGEMKAIKRKQEAPLFLEDLGFAAAMGGSASDLGSKKKKIVKKATPTPAVETSIPESAEDLSARATLIIAPLSVLSNWLDQLDQHVHANVKLNVYLYYGSERNRSKKFLSSQDVVITTYNVLSADFGNKSPLHGITWLRVVLDEGHVIRNPIAKMSKAVLDLKAQRRWILSGTPIQNSVKDMWMLLAFLRLKPFDVREWWNRVIQRPITQGDKVGLQNLQTLVKCITLRRTKTSEVNGRPLVSLPEKTVCVEQVELSQAEREEYELARNEGRSTISRYVAEGSVLRNYADVLVILMRLRQHCCHPDLIAKITSDLGASATPAELRERLIEKLRMVLASGSDEECSVCLDSVRLPVITHCAHVYCRPCIAQVISTTQDGARCPLCRNEIKTSELVEFPQEEVEEDKSVNSEKWRTSSKVQALMGNLLRLRCEDSGIKSLVVSQFTRFLTILETPLREHGFSFVRLDGSLSQKKRTQIIHEFQSSDSGGPSIMLLSLKAGGVGLNLTAASRVFLMDPAWNPATEEQCIDRCHRLGQNKKVFVTKFIVKDSVEENMVKIQRQKQDLVEKAFGSTNTDRKTSRIDEIKALMEL
ncbi:helicase-like transcription factor [Notolabrus celidotus]|uniref:helicase-like transcription factor n=1 Tax=Notolabrus celidotus TaxID=1203425 RepID=UPI001490571C|nr:helicase-like transcription factor [Notolabrus celidotus]XP_034531102.1 helicase-like transcription factor [Notolabrus celidotus]